MLGIKEIQEIIPHRHPFLLIDCIEELEPGVRSDPEFECIFRHPAEFDLKTSCRNFSAFE